MASDNDLRTELEALKKDLSQVRSDLSSLSGSAMEAGRDSARAAGQRARQYMDTSVDAVSETVSERPVTSLLVAAAAGAMVGILLGRK